MSPTHQCPSIFPFKAKTDEVSIRLLICDLFWHVGLQLYKKQWCPKDLYVTFGKLVCWYLLLPKVKTGGITLIFSVYNNTYEKVSSLELIKTQMAQSLSTSLTQTSGKIGNRRIKSSDASLWKLQGKDKCLTPVSCNSSLTHSADHLLAQVPP